MKLYRIKAWNARRESPPLHVQWVGTQAGAAAARKELVSKHHFARADIDTEEVEVPTNKPGLIEFLNQL